MLVPGVVDEDMEATESREGAIDQLAAPVAGAEVALNKVRSEALCRSLTGLLVDVANNSARSLNQQAPGYCKTNAARTAGE